MMSIQHLLVVLVIVMLVFGTKKIRGIGGDVGGWIRDFKKALRDGEQDVETKETAAPQPPASRVTVEGEVVSRTEQTVSPSDQKSV